MTNYKHKDVFVYFLVSDMFVSTPHGKHWNYVLFDWDRNMISYWTGLEGDAIHWATYTLNKLHLTYHQVRCFHRTQWENEK